MPIEIQYYSNGNRDQKLREEPDNDWTVVADTDHDTPLVAYSKTHMGTAFPDRPSEDEAEDENAPETMMNIFKAMRTATRGVQEARRQFRYGPVNNAMFPYDADGELDLTKPPKYICEPIQPYLLFVNGNTLEGKISRNAGPFVDLLARFYRGVRTGAGVCSTLSAVGAGLMSMYSMPDTETPGDQETTLANFLTNEDPSTYLSIVTVSHGHDHSFNIVSYKNSPWYVSDPWPAESYVLPISENVFSLDSIKSWAELRVYAPLKRPFGLPLMSVWKKDHAKDENKVPGLMVQPSAIRRAWGEYKDGLATLSEYMKAAPWGEDGYEPWVLGDKGWKPQERQTRVKGLSRKLMLQFHSPPRPYTHVTNLDVPAAEDGHEPVAKGTDWGDDMQQSGTASPAFAYKSEAPSGPPPKT